jgi:hypothetical protein
VSANAMMMADMAVGGYRGASSAMALQSSVNSVLGTAAGIGRGGQALAMGRAGLSGLGRGLLGGTMGVAMLPAMGVLMAAQAGAQSMHVGSQQSSHVRGFVDSNFNFMNANRAGGHGMGTGEVAKITKSLRDIATESGKTFEEVMGHMRDINDMGLLNTARNAKDVQKKMRQVMDTVETISEAMGVTVKEALGFYGSSRLSGMFTEAAQAGNMIQREVLGSHGFSGQQFTQLQRGGANIARAYGARRGQGARAITRAAGDIGRAGGLGIIGDDAFVEATGMEAGPEAYAQIAATMTQASLQFTKTNLGRAALAYAGEQDETGRYTGRIDAARMARLQSGEVSGTNLSQLAQDRMSSSVSKASFTRQERGGKLAGDFAERGGTQVIGQIVSSIAGERFGEMGKDDIATLLMEKFSGLDQVHAEMLADMAKNQGRLGRQRRQEEIAALDQAIMRQERQIKGGGFLGIGGAWRGFKQGWKENITDPLQQAGSDRESLRAMRAEDELIADSGGFRQTSSGGAFIANVGLGFQKVSAPVALGSWRDRGRVVEKLSSQGLARLGGVDNILSISPGQFTGAQLEVEQGREMRRATSSLALGDTGLSEIKEEDLKAASLELVDIMGPKFDVEEEGAAWKLAARASGRKGKGATTLQRLMRQAGGQGAGDPLAMDRGSIGQRADLVQYLLQEGVGIKGLGSEGRFGINAYSKEAEGQYKDARDKAFRFIKWNMPGQAAVYEAMEDPAAREVIFDIMEMDTSSPDAMAANLESKLKEMDRYVTLKQAGGEIPEDLQKYEAAGVDVVKSLRTAMHLSYGSIADTHWAGVSQGHLQTARGLQGAAVSTATRESRRQRGSRVTEALSGTAGKALRGRGALGSDVAGLVEKYAGAVSGEASGVGEAQAIADRLSRAGSGQRSKVMGDLQSMGGGLSRQVQALLDAKDLEGRDKGVEDLDRYFSSRNVEITDDLRTWMEDKARDGISAQEAREAGEMMAGAVGDRAGQEAGAVGGVKQGSVHGTSMEVARMLQETDRSHAIFAATTASAVERIAEAAGIEPASATRQVGVQ